ncbi:hypothetical protein B0H14DRAFT_3447410 [Mycena olivaceomarginata]|nr:hypothetical protein B0H14DRAFT_3447410 [Mycena olivaceomarginata]
MLTKVVLSQTPMCFDGTKSQWDNFRDQLLTYLGAYNDELDTHKKRVPFIISYLWSEDGKPCMAADWVHNWKKQVLINGVTFPMGDPTTGTGTYTSDHFLTSQS